MPNGAVAVVTPSRYPLTPGQPDEKSKVSLALWWAIARAWELFWLAIPISLLVLCVLFVWSITHEATATSLLLQGSGISATTILWSVHRIMHDRGTKGDS